jgi:membrane protease YdiL (CAAX protease family)
MSTINLLFWNRDQARLRAGWRLLVYGALWFILGYVAIYLRNTVSAGRLPEVYRTPLLAAIFTLLVVVFLTGMVGSRLLDRRPFADYGFHLSKGWWLDLGFGMALGTLLMVVIFGVELALGWTEITGTFVTGDSGQRFGPLILVLFTTILLYGGILEELTYRGYLLQNLAEGLNLKRIGPRPATLIAVLISSVVFGLGHAENASATSLNTINTTLVAALVLAAGYVLTGQLALPIGFHVAWNFVGVGVLGFSAGSNIVGASFLAISEHGPALWTGGTYGPLGGLLGTGASILGFVLIAAWMRVRRGTVRLDLSVARPPAR